MPSYILKTNRNSFTLRHKKYKRYRSDIWGYIAMQNRKNKFTEQMREFAERDLRSRLRRTSKKRRKILFKRFRLFRNYHGTFQYAVNVKPRPKSKKPLTMRGSLRLLGKKLKAFYYFRLRRKSLRKLFKYRNLQKARIVTLSVQNKRFFGISAGRSAIGAEVESRIDVILYRLNFISTIYDGRRFIKTKRAFVMGPCKRKRNYRKFFTFFMLKKHFHKVPLFHFVSLRYDLLLFRKVVLKHLVFAQKLLSYPPNYLMVNYKTMIGLRHINPPMKKVRYPFRGSLAHFIGAALYY